MNEVKFFKLNTDLPEFKNDYLGFFVMDKNGDFYIGDEGGWKKFLYENDLNGVNEILENILGE